MTVETLPVGFNIPSFTFLVHDLGQNPTSIIRTTDAWHIHVDWSTDGPLSVFLPGNWHVKAYLESIGPGQELDLGGNSCLSGSGYAQLQYSHQCDCRHSAGAGCAPERVGADEAGGHAHLRLGEQPARPDGGIP